LIYRGRRISYAQLSHLIRATAAFLQESGISKGDRVALFLPNIPQFVISFYAALSIGATVVPCNPLYKASELEFQLRDSESKMIIAVSDIVDKRDLYQPVVEAVKSLDIKVVTTSVTDFLSPFKRLLAPLAGVKRVPRPGTTDLFEGLLSIKGEPTFAKVDPQEDLALLQYTGGTTATPRGVMLTHRNLLSNAVMVSEWLPLKEGEDVNLAVIPFFHIYGLTVALNAPLLKANSIVLLPRFDVKQVLKSIQAEKVTVFCGVPAMYAAIIDSPLARRFNLRSLRCSISGAAALPRNVQDKFQEETSAMLAEGYGLTEAGPVTHCNPLDSREKIRSGSIGIPFPDTDAKIVSLDDQRQEVPVGEVGELAVKGPQVMKGYWKRSEETTKALIDGWLMTGDIAKRDDEGYFTIVDRKKDMINVGGFKVWPSEVEAVLLSHPAVKDAAVIGVPDARRGEGVKAYVVLRGDFVPKPGADDLRAYCSGRLAGYKVPATIEFREELPKTMIGKVLRRELRKEAS